MAWTFTEDLGWQEGSPKLIGPGEHSFWMATSVFDGSRAFDGMAPDIHLHNERVIQSAKALLLEPHLSAETITEYVKEGIKKFPAGTALYIRPMFYAHSGWVLPDAGSTRFCLYIFELPMPENKGLSITFSDKIRPPRNAAPTDAKAGCLYPNLMRALKDAKAKAFDNAVTFDPNGNVAELATANLWLVKDGTAITPAANGTFLAGITRNRVMQLLNDAGIEAREGIITKDHLLNADEIFSTGNFSKVVSVTRLEDRHLQAGPISRKARELYWEYSLQAKV